MTISFFLQASVYCDERRCFTALEVVAAAGLAVDDIKVSEASAANVFIQYVAPSHLLLNEPRIILNDTIVVARHPHL